MGSMDLKVQMESRNLVFACQETQRKSVFLSNIDQVLNFDVQMVHFFQYHTDFPPKRVADILKATLGKILEVYDFVGGRLRTNEATGRLEIECNGGGAGFVEASCESRLDDIGDLVYPNPSFRHLIMDGDFAPNDHPLCVFQVTKFKCGGFAIGTSTNHVVFDGLGFKTFMENLAALAGGKPLVVSPCNDRHLLAARSPPRVTFPHPELVKLSPCNGDCSSSNMVVHDKEEEEEEEEEEEVEFRVLRLKAEGIAKLKEKAEKEGTKKGHITGFNVVTAHIWRCKALASWKEEEERETTLIYAVDIRKRMEPRLPEGYVGNAVVTAYARAKCGEMKGGLGRIVEKVGEGGEKVREEYVRSVIDWGEVNRGYPKGEVVMSSWWRLGFQEVEYPWGTPSYTCPVLSPHITKHFILLFPPLPHEDGLHVLVPLPSSLFSKFHSLFQSFLSSP